MGLCCGCLKENKEPPSMSVLSQAKLMTETKTHKTICTNVYKRFFKKAEQEGQSQLFPELRILFTCKYRELTQIIFNLYLTGIGGINEEDITSKNISCIVNATYELSAYDVQGIQYIRIPVEDIEEEDISIYFDEVSDQIEEWLSHRMKVVVHCVCGVSRSATLVLAYLMKSKGMELKAAFYYVRERRPFIRPNNAFFQQLIDYERILFKRTTVHIITHKTKRGEYIKVADVLAQNSAEDEDSEQNQEGTIDSQYINTVSL